MRLSDEQRLDWLQLIRSENVGPRTFRSLVNHCGGARAAVAALPAMALRGGASRAVTICTREQAEKELAAAARMGVSLVALGEAEYPARLQEIADAPPLLGVRGRIETLNRPTVAIVGSRNASAAGLRFAEMLARGLGEAGLVVASGLARGIDFAAHRASMASGTVAVLAGGHDRIYPREHTDTLAQILDRGAAISEMPLGWEPRARDFPRRNRLISGVSLGVVLVEAARRSGSLITARMALEQGREVFAVPGSPLDPRCEGTNGLLKQSANLVTEVEDVVAVIRPMLEEPPHVSASEPPMGEPPGEDASLTERQQVIQLLGPTPVALDDLVRLSGLGPAIVRVVLLELELAGRLERQGGGLVSLVG